MLGRLSENMSFYHRTIILISLIALFLSGCSSLLSLTQPDEILPIGRILTVIDYEKDNKQNLFLTLRDSLDEDVYKKIQIDPDSLVYYINPNITKPYVKVEVIYNEHVEYRYNDPKAQRNGPIRSGLNRPDATISYLVPFYIYHISFPDMQSYIKIIPEYLKGRVIKYDSPNLHALFEAVS